MTQLPIDGNSSVQSNDKPVWLDMSQRTPDDAYDQEKYALNRAQITHAAQSGGFQHAHLREELAVLERPGKA